MKITLTVTETITLEPGQSYEAEFAPAQTTSENTDQDQSEASQENAPPAANDQNPVPPADGEQPKEGIFAKLKDAVINEFEKVEGALTGKAADPHY